MSPTAPRSASIPASYGLSLLKLMAERGHGDSAILAGCQLSRDQLEDQQGQIGGRQYMTMLNNALRLGGDEGIAYELGLRSQVTKHGFVGFGLISCATLREAIAFSERYLQMRVAVFRSAMTLQGDRVVIELQEKVPLGPQRPLILDLVVVELCSLFAKVLGTAPATSGWTSEIWVPYPEPPAYARYKDRLPRFQFNKPAVQIRFPARMLDEPIPSADPVSVRLAIDRCEQEMATRVASSTTVDLVRDKLVCRNGRYPDVAHLAQQLLMSERTLKRRLQEEGQSFQAVLDQVRFRDSRRLLDNPALSVKQVAQAVGYADPANFARAFAKWAGASPRTWRQTRSGSGPN